MKSADAGERAALVSTDFAAGLLDAMIDAVLLVDAHSTRIVAANRAAGTLVGVAPPTLCGSEVTELCASPGRSSRISGIVSGRGAAVSVSRSDCRLAVSR